MTFLVSEGFFFSILTVLVRITLTKSNFQQKKCFRTEPNKKTTDFEIIQTFKSVLKFTNISRYSMTIGTLQKSLRQTSHEQTGKQVSSHPLVRERVLTAT